ncbi:MAG: hypothetical protein ABI977_35965 [Acidobacteriota bacterium]
MTLHTLFLIVPPGFDQSRPKRDYNKMQQEQFYKETTATANTPARHADLADLPQCCGTGCAVCVLDYPELFSQSPADSETLAMLEAIEQAQLQADRLLAETSGDLQ